MNVKCFCADCPPKLYGLKCSQEDTLDVPWFPQTIFFQNWDVGALNFFLSVKNGTPEVCGQVYRGFPNPD